MSGKDRSNRPYGQESYMAKKHFARTNQEKGWTRGRRHKDATGSKQQRIRSARKAQKHRGTPDFLDFE